MQIIIKQNLRYVLLLSLLSISLSGCTINAPKHWPEKKGVVLELGTKKPLKDVFVTFMWGGRGGIVGVRSVCYHMQVTKTNAKGEFTMPSYFEGFSGLHRRHYSVFFNSRTHKEFKGTSVGIVSEQKVFRLKPITGTREERFNYLTKRGRGPSCHSAGTSKRSAFPIHKMVYEEVKSLAKTKEEKEKVKWLREIMASSIDTSFRRFTGEEEEKRIDEILEEYELREQEK